MAAGSSKAGTQPAPMTPGCLKRYRPGERDSFESRRVANRYSERKAAAAEAERASDSTSCCRYVPKWIVSVIIRTATL